MSESWAFDIANRELERLRLRVVELEAQLAVLRAAAQFALSDLSHCDTWAVGPDGASSLTRLRAALDGAVEP